MGKRKKKPKKSNNSRKKDAYFKMPLRAFMAIFPTVPFPPAIDTSDPAYVVRFRFVGRRMLMEIGYEDDVWWEDWK